MKEKIGKILFTITTIVQTLLHYLGLLGILLGGTSFIIIKYLIGFLLLPVISLLAKEKK